MYWCVHDSLCIGVYMIAYVLVCTWWPMYWCVHDSLMIALLCANSPNLYKSRFKLYSLEIPKVTKKLIIQEVILFERDIIVYVSV